MRFSESQKSLLSIGRASAFYVKMRFSESQESLLSIGQASAFYVKSLGALPNGRCKVTTFFRKIQIKIKTYWQSAHCKFGIVFVTLHSPDVLPSSNRKLSFANSLEKQTYSGMFCTAEGRSLLYNFVPTKESIANCVDRMVIHIYSIRSWEDYYVLQDVARSVY